MRTIEVVHVARVYPPNLGGLEKVVQTLAVTQQKQGKAVSVITSDRGVSGSTPEDTVNVTRLKSFSLANTVVMPRLLLRLLRVPRNSIVHVHVTQAYTPEMVWIASKLRGFRYIAHVHLDVPPLGPAGFLLKIYKPLVLKRVLHAAQFVIVFTEDQRRVFRNKYNLPQDQVKVIANGVEDHFYYDKKRILHKKPRLLYVGRLGHQKNLQQLLHALDGISEQFETTLVGDGELELELKEMAKELRLKNVTFAGRKGGKALLKYFKDSDIFVLPSEREGMPLVLLEAMAMGLPIVATDVTGNRDVVQNGKNGLLVPYNDAATLGKALQKIGSDARLFEAMSKAARKLSNQYAWDKIAATFDDVYVEARA